MDNSIQARPSFLNPPVVETLLSVQFEPIDGFRVCHFGLFWDRVSARFPRTEERAPITSPLESFLETSTIEPSFQFETVDVPPMPRVWFMSNSGSELIQLQSDRFIKNWRAEGDTAPYPRYPALREQFGSDFAIFERFLLDNRLNQPVVRQCEVTYVNHIVGFEAAEFSKLFPTTFTFSGPHPGPVEAIAVNSRFIIKDDSGNPCGRLHIAIKSTKRSSDGVPMIALTLTARGQSGERLEFLDIGRDRIVRSFREITTSAMHQQWGLEG